MYRLLLTLFLTLGLALQSGAYPGEVIKSFATAGEFPTGLTYDGEHLWMADRQTDLLYKLNAETGEVLKKLEAPGYWPTGLTFDGNYLWCSDVKGGIALSEHYDAKIYQIDPKDGTVIKTLPAPSSGARGLAWDGEYLWTVDNRSDQVIQFSTTDGTTIRSFKSPSGEPRGLTYENGFLWTSDRKADEIYRVDTESGSVVLVTDAPGPFAVGLAADEETLFALDDQTNKLYHLKMNDGTKMRRYNKREAEINYVYQARNYGPGNVKMLNAHLAIPRNRDNQEIIGDISYSEAYTQIASDKWDQKTAHYRIENLQPGETKNIRMVTRANIYETRYFVFPEKVGKRSDIDQKIKDKYLENNEKYQLNHPAIQKVVKKVNNQTDNPYWVARKLYDYLIDNMYYEMVGGWNTAPTVLERGNGSCSEYSFVYIALCRASGIPARYVGSVVVRGDAVAMDDVFHRWVEIYLPNYGWIPVDPSGGDQDWPSSQADYFGHLANRFLITTQSGGNSETMGWTYNSNENYVTEPKTHLVIDHFAQWDLP